MSNNPFPGLRPFEQKETHLFFGRDGQSKELLKRLQDSRFLALVGVSGSGKSSLVKAGLLPALYGGLMSSVESDWRIAVFRPGNAPIKNMARALVTEAGLGGGSGLTEVEVAIAETTLRRGNLGLMELLKQARMKVREDGRPFLGANENMLLVVDQFEEIFRIIEQYDELIRVKQLSDGNADVAGTADGLDHHPREEASAFVKLLLESTRKNKKNKYDENVYIIVTMRSDYLGDTAQFWGMPERINDGQYLIPRMNRDDRRKAIVGPVAVAGGSIAEPLVNQLLNDAGENPGHLPILQHALMRMWEIAGPAAQNNGGLDLNHYERIGKLSGALSQHANEAFDELSPQHQYLAAKVFKCLTEKGLANREIRRPMKIADICAVVGAKEEDVKTVVDCFRKKGRWFLMPAPHEKPTLTADTLIDISHESLISGWDKLRGWVNEEAESARTYKRLADTAILKEHGKEDFYRGPALQVALKWRDDDAPNPAWARRYHPEFDKAIAFLDGSLVDTQKREKAEKDRVAKELRRRRTYNIILGILTLVTAAVGAYAYRTQQQVVKEQEARAEREVQQRIIAEAGQKKAKELTKQAEDAQKQAEDAKDQAEGSRKRAQDAQKLAEDTAADLQESLRKEQAAVIAARKAQAEAIVERNKAVSLQNENQEQAKTYGYFKDALDQISERNYPDAIRILREGLNYFEGKERTAASDTDKQKSTTNRISAIVNIADIYRSDGDPSTDETAVQEYLRAINLIGSGNNKLLAPTLAKAGSVWKDSPDLEKARKAAEYYEMAAPIFRDVRKDADASRSWIEAGKIHLRFKDNPGRTKALEDFGKAVASLAGKPLALTNADIGETYVTLIADAAEPDDEEEDPQPRDNATRRDNALQNRLREDGAGFFLNASRTFEGLRDFQNAAVMQQKRGKILSESTSPDLVKVAAEAFRSAARLNANYDPTESASVLVDAGEMFISNDNKETQVLGGTLLEEAAKLDQQNPARQSATLSEIASIYASLDPPQKERALEYHQRAILFAQQHNDRDAQVTAILAKARGLERLEDDGWQSQVNQLYDQAVALYDDPANKTNTSVRIGKSILGIKRDEETVAKAQQYFQAAINLAQQQADKKIAASAYMEIGVAYRLPSRSKAADNFQKALAIYQAEGDLYGQAMALYRLSSVTSATKPLEFTGQALSIFERVLPTLQASDKQVELAEAYFAMGSLYRRKKEFPASLDSFNRALAIYQRLERLPDQRSRIRNVENLIRTTQRLKDGTN